MICFWYENAESISQQSRKSVAKEAMRLTQLLSSVIETCRSFLVRQQAACMAIARAIVIIRVYIILDEPLGATRLTLSYEKHLQRELKNLQRNLWIYVHNVTHDQRRSNEAWAIVL